MAEADVDAATSAVQEAISDPHISQKLREIGLRNVHALQLTMAVSLLRSGTPSVGMSTTWRAAAAAVLDVGAAGILPPFDAADVTGGGDGAGVSPPRRIAAQLVDGTPLLGAAPQTDFVGLFVLACPFAAAVEVVGVAAPFATMTGGAPLFLAAAAASILAADHEFAAAASATDTFVSHRLSCVSMNATAAGGLAPPARSPSSTLRGGGPSPKEWNRILQRVLRRWEKAAAATAGDEKTARTTLMSFSRRNNLSRPCARCWTLLRR